MSLLIDELKVDHVVLANMLTEAKNIGASSEKGRKKLLAAKDALLMHLKKEDEKLYPVLRKGAESNPGAMPWAIM